MKDEPTQHAVTSETRTTFTPSKPGCRCCRLVVAAFASLVVVAVVAAWGLGRWLEAPAQPASKADVIVVLGGDTGSRLLTTIDLYRRGLAPAILLAGVESDELSTYDPALNMRLQYLLGPGIPRAAIFVDKLSNNRCD